MSLPIEVQQMEALRSAGLNSPANSSILTFFSNILDYNFSDTLNKFWLVLPDYLVMMMLKIFSFSFILSTLFVLSILWLAINIMKARKKIFDVFNLTDEIVFANSKIIKNKVNEKWQKVLEHMNSSNSSDWKLAILECDIMLSDLLEKMGYLQESIGEKLKAIEPSDFTNIELAWEAHKIRNAIAHEGSDYLINEREAKRVVGLYEAVFREFELI